jgi:hypothetical protein
MGTRMIVKEMTTYQKIKFLAKNVDVKVKDIEDLDNLVSALESWGLNGSASRLLEWRENMYRHIDAEFAEHD